MEENTRIVGDKAKELEGFKLLKKAFKENEGIELIWNDDTETQKLGLDYEFELNGKKRICDDKFAGDYINKNLRTFCLELASKPVRGNGPYKKGWFVDESKITDTYLFKWLDNKKMDVIVVDRQRLVDEIKKKGWTLESLYEHAMKIDSKEESPGYKNGLRFVVSWGKKEKGIIVVLPRDFYRNLSDFTKTYEVDDTEMMRLCEMYDNKK